MNTQATVMIFGATDDDERPDLNAIFVAPFTTFSAVSQLYSSLDLPRLKDAAVAAAVRAFEFEPRAIVNLCSRQAMQRSRARASAADGLVRRGEGISWRRDQSAGPGINEGPI